MSAKNPRCDSTCPNYCDHEYKQGTLDSLRRSFLSERKQVDFLRAERDRLQEAIRVAIDGINGGSELGGVFWREIVMQRLEGALEHMPDKTESSDPLTCIHGIYHRMPCDKCKEKTHEQAID